MLDNIADDFCHYKSLTTGLSTAPGINGISSEMSERLECRIDYLPEGGQLGDNELMPEEYFPQELISELCRFIEGHF